jgi:hypothetical protein
VPYTYTDIANQFMRQFSEEDGALVYRRHGSGPAFRVNQDEVSAFLDTYMRRTRIYRAGMIVLTFGIMGGGVFLLDAIGAHPSEKALTIGIIALITFLVAGYVYLEMRNMTSPDRVLSARRTPVSAAYDSGQWSRTQLEKAPWINFSILPLAGLYIVWALRDEVDSMHGWGRLIWLAPLAFTLLAAIQAWRKWRFASHR